MRQEHRHHSDEQIRDAISFATALVNELDVPSDLREAAFQTACNLRTAKSIVEVAPPPLGVPAMAMPRGH